MSLSKQMRDQLEKSKNKTNSKDQLVDSFNDATLMLIKQFIGNVQSGAVSIDDTADVMRLFQIFEKINDIQTGDNGTGTLPAMTGVQKELMEDVVKTEKKIINGEEEDVVDLEELSKLSVEDITKMMNQREVQVNRDNEGMF